MRIACLMPTYGRRRELLENSIACFIAQEHSDKVLWIFDDLGTLSEVAPTSPQIKILSTTQRAASVGAKYNAMISQFMDMNASIDAFAVWDDDDIYLPNYLSGHAVALDEPNHWQAAWSKSSQIISAYHQPPQLEDASGRFHGSIAVTVDAWRKVPWINTTRATFDQEYIAALQKRFGDPARPPVASYVYRWQTSGAGHCSGLMGRADWYAAYQPDSREAIDRLEPRFDDDTKAIYKRYGHAT